MKIRNLFATLLLTLASRDCLADDVTWIASAWFDTGGGIKVHRWLKSTQPNVDLNDVESVKERCQVIARDTAKVTAGGHGWQGFAISGLSLQQTFLGQRAVDLPEPPDPPPGREIVAAVYVIPSWGEKPAAGMKDFPPAQLISLVAQGQIADRSSKKTQWQKGIEPLVNQIAEMRAKSGPARQTTDFALCADSVELEVMLPEESKQRVTFELRIDKLDAAGGAKADQVILRHLRNGSILVSKDAKDPTKGGFEKEGVKYYFAGFEVWDQDIPVPSKSVSISDREIPTPKDAKVLPEQSDKLFIKNMGGFWVFAYKRVIQN